MAVTVMVVLLVVSPFSRSPPQDEQKLAVMGLWWPQRGQMTVDMGYPSTRAR